jgi:hypothetical protein
MRALMSLIKDGLFVKGTALPHEIIYEDGEPVFTKADYVSALINQKLV